MQQGGGSTALPPLPAYANGRTVPPIFTGQPPRVSLASRSVLHVAYVLHNTRLCVAHRCCYMQGKATLAYSQPIEQAAKSQNRIWKIWLVCGDCVLIGDNPLLAKHTMAPMAE